MSSWPAARGLKQYEVLVSGTGAREQPITFSISSSGYVENGIYDELFKRGTRFLMGDSREKRLLPFLYTIDDLAKWDDINELRKSLPGLGISVKSQFILDQIDIANESASKRSEFLTKYCNVKQSSSTAWLPAQQVEAMSLEELPDLIKEKNPEALERLDLKNKRRLERAAEKALAGKGKELPSIPRYETLVIGVTWPREVLYERIRQRLDLRLKEGMIEEVEELRAKGATDEFLFKLGLEYRYILMYLRGEFADLDAFYDKLFMEIRHLAKEQMTWFRKRKDMHWIDMQREPFDEASRLIDGFLG